MSEQEQEKKKKKGIMNRISNKFKGEEPDDLVMETLSELKGIVGSMKEVFNDFEDGYNTQLEEERNAWQKMQTKLPKFLQSNETKQQEHRMERIKNNKDTLSMLEDNFAKLELVLTTSTSSLETISNAYVNTAIPGEQTSEALTSLEDRMNEMQNNMAGALSDINTQISLIKSAMDNVAGQLDEQGVVLESIDGKIDVLDTKMDRAQELMKKISKQITGNRLIMLVIAGTATAVIAQKFLV